VYLFVLHTSLFHGVLMFHRSIWYFAECPRNVRCLDNRLVHCRAHEIHLVSVT